ncbi:MAG: hypothetical protein QOK05_1636 [Chloroflexota bacterium]|nr:hypothetical protein [Chloroflexota bacterium]
MASLPLLIATLSCSLPPPSANADVRQVQPVTSASPQLPRNTVQGSGRKFELDFVFSGSVTGEMVTATSTAGLCDPSEPSIESILSGSIGTRHAVAQFVTDRRAGPIGGAFVLNAGGHSYSSFAAHYTLGRDLTSGSLAADLGEAPRSAEIHVTGSWRCV